MLQIEINSLEVIKYLRVKLIKIKKNKIYMDEKYK